MSGPQGTSIVDLADEVVRADVTAQAQYATWTKGTPIGTGYLQGPRRLTSLLLPVVLIALVGAAGLATGVLMFGGQPAPSLVALASQSPASAMPSILPPTTQPLPTETPTNQPTPSLTASAQQTPTETPTQNPSAVANPLDSLAAIIDMQDLLDVVDEVTDPGTIDPSEEPRDAPDYANLTGMRLARAELTRSDVAALGALTAALDDVAVIGDQFPCSAANVFCGPAQLQPGAYYFVGFSTLGPPPTHGQEGIYANYYLLTDPDTDWSNNVFTTPPRTDYPLDTLQVQIEGGWYGTASGLGETDTAGPVGPDGRTPRYNRAPDSRLVFTQDPPGGFFIVPAKTMGDWFRVASYWGDLNQTGVIAVDNISLGRRNELLPVAGLAAAPAILECARVDAVAAPLDDQPATLDIVLGPARPLPVGAQLEVGLTVNGVADPREVALEPQSAGTYLARLGVPVDSALGFETVLLAPPDGDPIDASLDFFVLAGNGINLQTGYAGLALGDPDCGG